MLRARPVKMVKDFSQPPISKCDVIRGWLGKGQSSDLCGEIWAHENGDRTARGRTVAGCPLGGGGAGQP